MSEYRLSSLSGRKSPLISAQTDSQEEIVLSGYLNRKCINEPGGRKSKDRSWITLWCALKGTVLEFYRVEGVSPKPNGHPPSRELFPPPSLKQSKFGFVDVENSSVDIDYTSQMNKDIDKRRQHLFNLELINNTKYLFQAPAEKNRTSWVMSLKHASRKTPLDDIESSLLGQSIKTSRDSIKQKSKHNVHSIKKPHTSVPVSVHGKMGSIDESELLEVPVAQSMAGGDPNLRLLKKRLQAKKELLKQLKVMYTSFMGGSGALYAEALIHHEGPSPEHIAKKEGVVHRRMSLPESKGQEEGEDKRSSTGDYCVSITTPVSPGVQSIEGVLETELLVDYYLVPGAQWSLLKRGETVRVLGRANNGWYQCAAMRNTTVNMEFDATSGYPLYTNLTGAVSDLSIPSTYTDSGVEFSLGSEVSEKRNSGPEMMQELGVPLAQKTSSSLSDLTSQREEELCHRKVSIPNPETTPTKTHVGRTESYLLATEGADDPLARTNVGRTDSYLLATEEDDSFESLLPKREVNSKSGRRKAATVGRSVSSITPSTQSNILIRQARTIDRQKRRSESTSLYVTGRPPSPKPWRLMTLLEKERQMGNYHAPLIGCVAPSALKCFAEGGECLSSSGEPHLSVNGHKDAELRNSSSLSGEIERPPSDELSPELQSLIPDSEQSTEVLDLEEPESPSIVVEFEVVEEDQPVSTESIPETSDLEPASPMEEEVVSEQIESLEAPPPFHLDTTNNIPEENECVTNEKVDLAQSDESKEESSASISPIPVNRAVRAKSLPPPVINHTPPASPVHAGNVSNTPATTKTKPGKKGSLDTSSDSKSSRIKKFFSRKKPGRSASSVGQTLDPNTAHTSSPLTAALVSPIHKKQRPHTITRKPKSPIATQNIVDDFESPERRIRVSSVSGRPVRREGVGLVIGDDSSSESEDENEEEPASIPEDAAEDQPGSTPQSLDNKQFLSRQVSDSAALSEVRSNGIKRSASEHDSLALKASLETEVTEEQPEVQPRSAQSLKRGMLKLPSFRKPRSNSEEVTSPSRKAKPRKRGATVADMYKLSETGTPTPTTETNTKWDVIFRAPPRGEKRYVYLDPTEGAGGKYGFRLQSYGRIREQGKVLQTFVQSVVPGSVSFLAGLYPGDTIIEVNGVDMKYTPVENVVKAIQEGARKMERIALKVEFVDGVTRLDGMKRSDDVKAKIKDKQSQLKKLIDQSKHSTPTPLSPLHSPQALTSVTTLTPWGETTPTSKPKARPFEYNRRLNSIVAVYQESVVSLQCDVLVLPLSSCHQPSSGTENVLLHLLKTGGEGLLDELSLAKQCRLGENIITGGHGLQANSIYHCVFGTLEESLQKCCVQALSDASSRGHRSIVFWLDGFASLSVSPQIIIESVRQWLGGNNSVLFDRVVFAAKANLNIIENFLEDSFPLEPFTQRDSIISEQGSTVNLELGNEATESKNLEPDNQNETLKLKKEETETPEKLESGTESDQVASDMDRSPLHISDEEVTKDEDKVGDLPERNTNPSKPPLEERTSVSDIGIQLDLTSDEELDNGTIELRMSDSGSEGDLPPLLKCLSEEPEKTEMSAIEGSESSTPQMSRSALTGGAPLSKSVPTRGLVVIVDEVTRSPSPGSSPRSMVLNPERQESEV